MTTAKTRASLAILAGAGGGRRRKGGGEREKRESGESAVRVTRRARGTARKQRGARRDAEARRTIKGAAAGQRCGAAQRRGGARSGAGREKKRDDGFFSFFSFFSSYLLSLFVCIHLGHFHSTVSLHPSRDTSSHHIDAENIRSRLSHSDIMATTEAEAAKQETPTMAAAAREYQRPPC